MTNLSSSAISNFHDQLNLFPDLVKGQCHVGLDRGKLTKAHLISKSFSPPLTAKPPAFYSWLFMSFSHSYGCADLVAMKNPIQLPVSSSQISLNMNGPTFFYSQTREETTCGQNRLPEYVSAGGRRATFSKALLERSCHR